VGSKCWSVLRLKPSFSFLSLLPPSSYLPFNRSAEAECRCVETEWHQIEIKRGATVETLPFNKTNLMFGLDGSVNKLMRGTSLTNQKKSLFYQNCSIESSRSFIDNKHVLLIYSLDFDIIGNLATDRLSGTWSKDHTMQH
jgi:hypothetical protein